MGNRMGFRQQRTADFPARGIAVRVQNPRTAVRRLSRERQLGSRAVELGSPIDKLRDVPGPFLHQRRNGFRAAEAVSGVDGVLLMQPDLVFVAQGDCDSALRVCGRGFAQVRFCEHQHVSRTAQLDGSAQPRYSRADYGIVHVIGFGGRGHEVRLPGRTFSSR